MPIVSGADSSCVELMNISSSWTPSARTFWRTRSQISLNTPSWSATVIEMVSRPLLTTMVRDQIGSSTSVGRRL